MRFPIRASVATGVLLVLFSGTSLFAQYQNIITYNLTVHDEPSIEFVNLTRQWPEEARPGIEITDSGEIFFYMNNEEWYKRIFLPGTSVTVDLVTSDQYDCQNYKGGYGFKGTVIRPLPQEKFTANRRDSVPGQIRVRMGRVPLTLKDKDVEANFVIIYHNQVCCYLSYIHADAAAWDLLPMGLYTDSLVRVGHLKDSVVKNRFTFEQKMEVSIPFAKNSDRYQGDALQRLFDSLHLAASDIQRVEIRAFASVEGSEGGNNLLMKGRANAIIAQLRKWQPGLQRVATITTENWLDFYQNVKNTRYSSFASLTRSDVRNKLLDPATSDSLEPVLAKERVVLVTLYYQHRTGFEKTSGRQLTTSLSKSIADKQIDQAREMQLEVFRRIADNRLPAAYLDKLEIPREKTYADLLNDQNLYKYWLKPSGGHATLEECRQLLRLDSGNARVAYNFCALSLLEWQLSPDSFDIGELSAQIKRLEGRGIPSPLVRRMMVNYHILLSARLDAKGLYAETEKSLQYIRDGYASVTLSDEDRFALAKYYTYYTKRKWAEELLMPRVDQPDVSEDLLFYYVNLEFYRPRQFSEAIFQKALLNCLLINRTRYCRFFTSAMKGGASFQLLQYFLFRELYCENCVVHDEHEMLAGR
jgi:hypothetical protein